jgi:hypothetical protein
MPDRDYINEHRQATGHPRRGLGTSERTLALDEIKIEVFAPYGEDPWTTYVDEDFAKTVLNRKTDPISAKAAEWVRTNIKTETGH